MKKYTMHNKHVHAEESSQAFHESYDVVVSGLGTAGAVALISAARQGLKVLGVEPMSCMGGIGTAGGIHYYHFGSKGGIQVEINERCAVLKDAYYSDGVMTFHPEVKKYVLDQMAEEAGASCHYNSVVTAAYAEGQRVVGVEVLGPDGIKQIQTKYIIDASGDAHTAAMLGCAARFGREIDGYPQPYSFIRGAIGKNNMFAHNNIDDGYVDPRDPQDMSKATINATAYHCWDEYTEEKNLTFIAQQFGLREGRFIIGEETVSFEDVINERQRDNMVMQTWSHHDNHCSDWAFESQLSQEYALVANLFSRGQVAEIPPGIFIPQGWDGLLIAGRCVSLDHDSHQGIRMQQDMQKFGEITGVMAALAIKHQCRSVDIPIKELQDSLLSSGCLPAVEDRRQHLPWLTDREEIKKAFSAEFPEGSLWSARLLGEAINGDLHKWVEGEDPLLKRRATWALGLQHDVAAIPYLIHDIETYKEEVPMDHSHDRGRHRYASICLLGILADQQAEEYLSNLLQEINNDAATATHVLVALMRIAEKNPQRRQDIVHTVTAYFQKQTEHLLTLWNKQDRPIDLNDFSVIYIMQCCQRWEIDCELVVDPRERREREMLSALAG